MKKIIISIILIALGIYTLMFWGAGMHGHIMFRPHKLEDWILSAIVATCFGVPLFFLYKWTVKKIRTKKE
jgi:hypothetical protein